MALRRRTKGPFRLTTPSTESNPQHSDSETSPSSREPSRSPSILSDSDTSTTSDDDDSSQPSPLVRTDLPVDDTDGPANEPEPLTISEAIRRAKFKGNYFPPDHFLAPPTPEQLRRVRKRKPRKLLFSFVRQHVPPKRELFVDPRVQKRVKADKTNWETMSSVDVLPQSLDRQQYLVNSNEFKPVKVLHRVYKPIPRRRRTMYEEANPRLGVGGYVIRFADGHEHCLNAFIERYPGLDELIEEFEHITMAREDEDRPAIAYFKKQRKLREEAAAQVKEEEEEPLFLKDTLEQDDVKSLISNHL